MLFIYSLSVLWLSCCFCWGCELCSMLKGRAAAAWHLVWSSHMNTGSPLQSFWPRWGAVFPCKLSSSHLPELSHPSQLPPKACNNTAKLIDTAAVRGPSFPLHSIPRIPNAALAWSGFSFPLSSQVRDGFQHRSAQGAQELIPWSHGSPPVSSSPLSPPVCCFNLPSPHLPAGFCSSSKGSQGGGGGKCKDSLPHQWFNFPLTEGLKGNLRAH